MALHRRHRPAGQAQISEYFVAEQAAPGATGDEVPDAQLPRAGDRARVRRRRHRLPLHPRLPGAAREDPESEVNRPYYENAERILLQSVAAATMSAHLAAAALGYNVWWVTAIGQADAQAAIKPLLGVPDELSVIDIMCFGRPPSPPTSAGRRTCARS